MTFRTLVYRGLRYYARSHLGVVLGSAIGSAALVGALVVGDSVKESLREMALARLGRVDVALAGNDRLFRSRLAPEMAQASAGSNAPGHYAAALQLAGVATAVNGSARANHVQVLGVDENFWKLAGQPPAFADLPADAVALNTTLADQLQVKPGDLVVLRVQKPSLLSRDAPVSSQNDLSVALRAKIQAVIPDAQFGRFSLQANQTPPFNAFVNLDQLQKLVGQPGRANLLLHGGGSSPQTNATTLADAALAANWQLADAELTLRALPDDGGTELRSRRVFLDPVAVGAARQIATNTEPILTYFVNELRSPPFATPYSMVTAAGPPLVPADLRDDEMLVNSWLAEDLQTKPGDPLSLSYFVMGKGRALEERRQTFRVRGVVPMAGAAADPGLMPDFPGLAEAESSSDWDAGFAIDFKRIRPKDEQYWKAHHGTPKAFVTLNAGKKMWANRFGDLTAVRFPPSAGTAAQIEQRLRAGVSPASLGLAFQPVREQALAASSQAVDFGGLFLGFSFFLIVAALMLMGLMFQFGLEERAREIGTLLALGFRPARVRRLFLGEGAALALLGGVAGMAGGIAYAKAMLLGLRTIWRGAVGTSALQYHATPQTLFLGLTSSALIGVATIWITLRRQGRQPARELLADGGSEKIFASAGAWKRSWGIWIGPVALLAALGMLGNAFVKGGEAASPDAFFSAGSLLLIAALAFCALWLAAAGASQKLTLAGLGLRGCGRRRKRSLTAIGLIASGIFLIVAIGAFRMDATTNAEDHLSGTGGFSLIGEASFPITYNLNTPAGRDFYGLNSPLMKNVRAVAFRVHEGDDASCLNLNRARAPRLLGVNPNELQRRQAFTFFEVIAGAPRDLESQWRLLAQTKFAWKSGPDTSATPASDDEIPGIADENSIVWAMGKKIGDTVDYTDAHGRPFKVRLVGALANSILQGNLVIDEDEFLKRFPDESGYRLFLFDAPSNQLPEISALLTGALRDAGLEVTPAARRLDAFNAVQNTYLSTFQVLGGLGLLLGSAGLGVVVLRNVQERRGELALMLAAGFRRRTLQGLVLGEHGALLVLGMLAGIASAVVAVLPAWLAPGMTVPLGSLIATLAVILFNGLFWTWLATRWALRGKLRDALRSE